MKRALLILAAALLVLPASAKDNKKSKMEPWQDPNVFEENRMPMRATFTTDQQKTYSLNGVWKFNWNETIEGRTKGFEAVNYDDSSWGTMPVPGMWELNGYGEPLYLNIGYPWRGNYQTNPPYPATERNYVGQYRKTFTVDPSWIGKQVCLYIGSATSNVRVWLNGKHVGYSQDSKLEARFDLTPYIKAGENVIALEIFRWCDGTYLEDQDFNRFAGIARDVYVYTREKDRIEDVNIVAGMDGDYSVLVKTTSGVRNVKVCIVNEMGQQVASGSAVPSKNEARITGSVASPMLWSAEVPTLYTLKVEAMNRKGLVESTEIPFGFRTVEIVGNQLKVNGQTILFKGVDRHEMNAYKGYEVSEADMIKDLRIMKELNINAIRTCHYPDDPLFLALCDKYGFYVVDEGNIESHGMGYGKESLAHREDFKAAHLARDQRMVLRDINHPSVVIWSMGNEAGNGENFHACYDWIKAHDKTRPVQYERAWGDYDTDIHCPMYVSPESCEREMLNDPKKPLIQCEYAHAMGNSIGNFKEYWDLIRKYPAYQGGFIWDYVDQALYTPSNEEGTDHLFTFGGDFNEYDPSDGSFNCNGVIAADRSLHPHAYEVRYQYRSIHTSADGEYPDKMTGVKVYNENFFMGLDGYRMLWNLTVGGEQLLNGVVENLDVKPQETKTIAIPLPGEMLLDMLVKRYGMSGDVCLNVSYELTQPWSLLPAGFEVSYDQILLRKDESKAFVPGSAAVNGKKTLACNDAPSAVTFSGCFSYAGNQAERASSWTAVFSKGTGALVSYKIGTDELLSEPLMPQFGRAPIENDMGARLNLRQGVWMYPEFKLRTITAKVADDGDGYTVVSVYEPIADGAAQVTMTYRIHADGSIEGTEAMKDAGGLDKAPNLFRFGMSFTMPGKYSTLDFYGLGPWENYADRNSAATYGHYVQSVNDQYHYGYVRTQESGTHTQMKFMRLLDDNGTGLEISSDVRFSGSALPFSIKDLDCTIDGTPVRANKTNTQNGAAKHSLSLKGIAHENDRANGKTCVNFELVQQGVGGNNSWGALPLDQYLVKAQEREFHFVIRPVNN